MVNIIFIVIVLSKLDNIILNYRYLC